MHTHKQTHTHTQAYTGANCGYVWHEYMEHMANGKMTNSIDDNSIWVADLLPPKAGAVLWTLDVI